MITEQDLVVGNYFFIKINDDKHDDSYFQIIFDTDDKNTIKYTRISQDGYDILCNTKSNFMELYSDEFDINKCEKSVFYKGLIYFFENDFKLDLDEIEEAINDIPFTPEKVIWNPEGKDCHHCKWKNDRYTVCQNAMCPKGNDGNGFHAFESDGTL